MYLENFYNITSLQGSDVPLLALLDAKEKRARLQKKYCETYKKSVLSVTLVAMGGVKRNPLLDYVFKRALDRLNTLFQMLKIVPLAQSIQFLSTGHEAIFALSIDPRLLKQYCIEIEESLPLARLWDIDVITPTGEILNRTDFYVPARTCLLCNENAKICARTRKHALADLHNHMQNLVAQDYLVEKLAYHASDALVEEACLTPKPGLVDAKNTGSHQDMNVRLLQQSARVLRPYFAKFIRFGQQTADLPISEVLSHLRPLGIKAEEAMFLVTKGVNTHKGAVFSFGLVCTAIGRLSSTPNFWHHEHFFTLENICTLVADMCQGITKELSETRKQPITAGITLFKQYGVKGARGEAEAGFPLLRKYFSIFDKYQHLSFEHQKFLFLLHLMHENADTNILHRGGLDGLNFIQQQAKSILDDNQIYHDLPYLKSRLEIFDAQCMEKNLSAGGSADLLALSIFLHALLRVNFDHSHQINFSEN